MASTSSSVELLLQSAGLFSLSENFKRQHIDTIETCKCLSDPELNSLGLATIGDRARFRSHLQSLHNSQPETPPALQGRTTSRPFQPSRSRAERHTGYGGRKQTFRRTYTATFMCMSDVDQFRVPSHSEKLCLQKAGLGLKKITFNSTDNEGDVKSTLIDGFPKLGQSGGFELMYCTSNCRQLKKINCKWDAAHLKTAVGPQSRIYIRPIQKCLMLDDNEEETQSTLTYACSKCRKECNVNELREHIGTCGQLERYDSHIESNSEGPTNSSVQYVMGTRVDNTPEGETNSSVQYVIGTTMDNTSEGPTNNSVQYVMGTTMGNDSEGPTNNSVQYVIGTTMGNNSEGLTNNSVQYVMGTTRDNDSEGPTNNSVQYVMGTTTDNTSEGPTNNSVQYVIGTTMDSNSEGQNDTSSVHMVQYAENPGISSTDDFQKLIENCIEDITIQNITDPIHCLKYIATKVMMGRKLDIEDEDVVSGIPTGATNFIIVNRDNILTTGMEEISGLENLRLTLEVQFYGETASDYGGPRKEFFCLVLPAIKTKFFEPVREFVDPKEYETVGKILALSMLQNGKLPRILDPDTLGELFGPNPRKVLAALGKGMDALGMFQLIKAHPLLIHLITPVATPQLTLKMVMQLLKPDFSESGSNRRVVESALYQKFVKYLREIAAGRRGDLNPGTVLKFVTGTDEEPPLGFGVEPSLGFVENASALPTANTCSNRLSLSICGNNLPEQDLFKLYDYGFSNSYFGLV